MTDQPTSNPPPVAGDDEWGPCPAGEIAALAERRCGEREAVRRRRWLANSVSLAAGFLLAAGAYLAASSLMGPYAHGGITCSECIVHCDDFLAGCIADEALAERVRIHFERCPKCGPHLDAIRARREQNTARTSGDAFVRR